MNVSSRERKSAMMTEPHDAHVGRPQLTTIVPTPDPNVNVAIQEIVRGNVLTVLANMRKEANVLTEGIVIVIWQMKHKSPERNAR